MVHTGMGGSHGASQPHNYVVLCAPHTRLCSQVLIPLRKARRVETRLISGGKMFP